MKPETTFSERIADIDKDIEQKNKSLEDVINQKDALKDSLAEFEEKQAENDRKHEEITAQIEDISSKMMQTRIKSMIF